MNRFKFWDNSMGRIGKLSRKNYSVQLSIMRIESRRIRFA